jgi:RNA polymerase sigma factor (TIGR02999 family)
MSPVRHTELPPDSAQIDAAAWQSLYDELRALARRKLRAESSPDLLQPTALVNEAWLRLAGHKDLWRDRRQFLRLAARVMRHVLVDQARALAGPQRGAGGLRVTLDSRIPDSATIESTNLLDIDSALNRLAADNARCAEALELHYFGGMTYEEIAEALATSAATVKRDLRSGRAWLLTEVAGGGAT